MRTPRSCNGGALVLAGLVLVACEPAPRADTGAIEAAPVASRATTLALAPRTLELVPSRADFSVATAVLSVFASRPDEVRIDGGAPLEPWTLIELERVGRDRFALPAVRVDLAPGHEGLVALSLKVWFAEVDNRHDALYYARGDDRYALVAFATRAEGPGWEEARPRFSQNRVATLEAFEAALSRPIPIALNDRPLSDVPADDR